MFLRRLQTVLHEPLVVAELEDGWTLIDGRNRREACRIAGIEPAYRELGGDPTAYVISANIHRRHMTKGQRAIAVAMVYPEPDTKWSGSVSERENVSKGRLSMARTVIKYASDLADGVLAGQHSLDVVYTIAIERNRAQAFRDLDVVRLRKGAPDLAQRVEDDELTIGEAKTLRSLDSVGYRLSGYGRR